MTRWLVLAAVAIGLALAFTAPLGIANQATYLLDPLHRAHPELFAGDWFVGTPPYLPAFGWLAEWLYRIGDGTAAVIAAHVIVMVATYVALYWLVTAVATDIRAYVTVASFSTITWGRAMGGSYLFTPYLQPSSLATLGWICALAALLRGRYLVCGIALALAGIAHPNFLVLGFGLFGLAALARRGVTVREAALLLGPQLAVLAWYAPELWAAAGPSAEAVRVLVEFHAPGHYAGPRLAVRIPEIALWLVAARAALYLVPERGRALAMLWRFSLIAGAIAIVTTLIVLIPQLQALTQPRWSRIAPYAQLGCQLIVVGVLVQHRARWWIAVTVVIAVVATLLSMHASIPAIVIGAAITAMWLAPVRHAATACAALALAVALWKSPRTLTTRPFGAPAELALEQWAREHTPIDALFVVPPEMGRFRLLAQRSVIADIKSPPLRSDLLVAWHRRLCAMVLHDTYNSDELVARYAKLSPSELAKVAHELGASHIVVRLPQQLPGPPIYANATYAVYSVP